MTGEARTLTVTGKGRKTRIVPLLPGVVSAVRDYLKACPWSGTGSDPLFMGAKGGRLNPPLVQKSTHTLRLALGLPPTPPPHPAPPACSARAATWLRSRNCWATPPSPPPSVIPTSTPSICCRSTRPPPRGRDDNHSALPATPDLWQERRPILAEPAMTVAIRPL